MAKEKKEIKAEIEIPEGVTLEINSGLITTKGKGGEVSKILSNPNIKITKEGNLLYLKALKSTKRERKMVNTFKAHIKNMLKGANEAYTYKLKICSGHFPMNVIVKDKDFTVKNFFGEKIPRKLKIKEGVNVKVEGNIIMIDSPNKESAGQVAADIEQLVRRTKYDIRIFQDGIWITEKEGKEIK